MKVSADYRSTARTNLKDNWGNAVLVVLIVSLLTSLLGIIPYVGAVATIILSGQLIVGMVLYFTRLYNRQQPKVGVLFEDFGQNWISNMVTYLVQNIYIFLWALLFIIPGIIKSYSYSMTMYLKSKNPKLTTKEAIETSMKMMDGNKWRLFCLHFSFIGWILLCILTLGIGFLFLAPYMQASVVAFYEDTYNAYQVKNGLVIDVDSINNEDNNENDKDSNSINDNTSMEDISNDDNIEIK